MNNNIDIEQAKCEQAEPILFAVKDYVECAKHYRGQTLCAIKKSDLHTVPLYTTTPDQSAEIERLKAQNEKLLADINSTIERCAVAIENAQGDLRTVQEYVDLLRKLKTDTKG